MLIHAKNIEVSGWGNYACEWNCICFPRLVMWYKCDGMCGLIIQIGVLEQKKMWAQIMPIAVRRLPNRCVGDNMFCILIFKEIYEFIVYFWWNAISLPVMTLCVWTKLGVKQTWVVQAEFNSIFWIKLKVRMTLVPFVIVCDCTFNTMDNLGAFWF
jgi:hypothetical protein